MPGSGGRPRHHLLRGRPQHLSWRSPVDARDRRILLTIVLLGPVAKPMGTWPVPARHPDAASVGESIDQATILPRRSVVFLSLADSNLRVWGLRRFPYAQLRIPRSVPAR